MNKKLIAILLMVSSGTAIAQVGINTENPKATLEIAAKNSPAVFDGIIAPKLTGDQLSSKTYTSDQSGAIVYVTAAATQAVGQVIEVTKAGYFYFDGTTWKTIGGSSGNTTTTNTLNSSSNSMTSNVNGVTSSANIINTNTITTTDNNISTSINGVTSSSATVPNLYTTNGTIAGNRVVSLSGATNTVTFTRTAAVGTTDTPVLSTNGSVQTIALRLDSDARLKENIKPINGNIALQLNPVTYHWNQAGKNKGGSNKLQYGFIAQEVEKVMPDAVFTDKDGYKSVNYIEVIPVLTQKIKDQDEIISELIRRVEKLENSKL